jgi:hypothetical protein
MRLQLFGIYVLLYCMWLTSSNASGPEVIGYMAVGIGVGCLVVTGLFAKEK